jgi:RNA polymerase sigma factor (sigma-70 family)
LATDQSDSDAIVSNAQEIQELYEEHGGELLHYLGRRCPDGAAPDLLQEIFLQVVRHRTRLKEVTAPRAWLFGIARHILARHYREQLGVVSLHECWAENDAKDTADPRLPLMRRSIEQLPRELRETLELRLEQEMSYEEISRVLRIPIGTVRSRLHAAVLRLRSALTSQKETK